MSRRLTKTLRKKILVSIVKSTFEKRMAKLLKEQHAITTCIYTEYCRGLDASMKSFPKGFFIEADSISVCFTRKDKNTSRCLTMRINEEGKASCNYSSLRLPSSKLFPHALYQGNYTAKPNSSLNAQIFALHKKYSILGNDINKCHSSMSADLEAFNTVPKLLEVWPEAAKFIPPLPPATQPLVVTGKDINNMLKGFE